MSADAKRCKDDILQRIGRIKKKELSRSMPWDGDGSMDQRDDEDEMPAAGGGGGASVPAVAHAATASAGGAVSSPSTPDTARLPQKTNGECPPSFRCPITREVRAHATTAPPKHLTLERSLAAYPALACHQCTFGKNGRMRRIGIHKTSALVRAEMLNRYHTHSLRVYAEPTSVGLQCVARSVQPHLLLSHGV